VQENFAQIGSRLEAPDPALEQLRAWSIDACSSLRDTITARRRDGFVRECHGDAHLANMVLLDGHVQLFDCLEFNPELRWIDVMSELAFLVMDLAERGYPGFARRALNGYLEHTGDYAGLAMLRFYLVYRALVRAKVAMIRLRQPGLHVAELDAADAEYRSYVQLARVYTRAAHPWLAITHGPSGAGKTWIAQHLVEATGAVRLRSDVERKRLRRLAPLARSHSETGGGLYTQEMSAHTYARLAELAGTVLDAGCPVIVDATFLERARRDQLRAVARSRGVRFVILDIQAPEAVLRERVERRAQQAVDASEAGIAVLERQLAHIEPLAASERTKAVSILNDGSAAVEACLREVVDLLART
jgi:prepilin-type processing-associated H-X9-DG protein